MSAEKKRRLRQLQMSIVAEVWDYASTTERQALAALTGMALADATKDWADQSTFERQSLLTHLILVEVAAPALNRARLTVHP